MTDPQQELTNAIDRFLLAVESSFDSHLASQAVVSLIRELDLLNASRGDVPVIDEKHAKLMATGERMVRFGFPLVLKHLYPFVVQCATHIYSTGDKTEEEWAQEVIYKGGKAAICRQLMDGIPAGLVKLSKSSATEFVFSYNHAKCGIEYFDEVDAALVRNELIARIQDKAEESNLYMTDALEESMQKSLMSPLNKLILYDAPDDVWELFLRQAPYQLILMDGHDDFSPDDIFGGIPYADYYEAVIYIVASALMHTHYCQLLSQRNNDIDLGVILTYIQPYDKAVQELKEYLDISHADTTVILNCLCMSEMNYEMYLSEPGASPPPYIKVSESQLVRSTAGCMLNPFHFLHKNLKETYSFEYSKAVNEREVRFMNDLYRQFEGDRFITINKPVIIKSEKGVTDIDAIIYDTHTKALGLFQLKWQDPLGESIKLRRTKAENLHKANDWVDKICSWLKKKNGPEILTATRVMRKPPKEDALGEVFLFVLGRHNIHFTDSSKDDRAVWASWQGVLASYSQIAAFMEDDPIRMMYTKLRIYEAEARIRYGEIPPTEYDMELGPYKITHLPA